MRETKGRIFSIEMYKSPTKAQLAAEKRLEKLGLEFIGVGMGTADYIAHDQKESKAAKDYLKHSPTPAFETDPNESALTHRGSKIG